MLWRMDTMDAYVLSYRDGNDRNSGGWQTHNDDWDGSNPDGVGLSPPPGLQEPLRGFGWVWRRYLGAQDAMIGWGRDEERGLCVKVQSFEGGSIFRSSQKPCSNEYNRAEELPVLLFALQGNANGEWWRY